jgi:hypothetical protein
MDITEITHGELAVQGVDYVVECGGGVGGKMMASTYKRR